jgi:protein-S-isoprenylcysteine O-methyltransferase Ste14
MALLLKNLLFTLLVPGSVAFYIPLLIASPSPADGAPHWIRWLGLASLALGVAIYLWCAWDFASFGRGTPAPIDAPTRLVVRGLYRYVRNPMYVGVLSAIVGWALYFASEILCLYAAAVWTAFHLFVVLYEEPNLRRRFGTDYERYCAVVNRWLVKPSGGRAA